MKHENELLTMIECLFSLAKELMWEDIHHEKKEKENFNEFNVVFKQVKEMIFLLSSKPHFDVLTKKVLVNIESSFNLVVLLDKTNKKRSQQKIEFELVPLLKIFYISCYYFSLVYGDRDREDNFERNEYKKFISNHYIAESQKKGVYKYEATFMITGYNKLDYTKQCVDSLIDSVPSSLSYELILINHGSTDETSTYFESVCEEYPHLPIKKIDLKENDLLFSIYINQFISEGEFFFGVSNDIIFCKNSIKNILACIKADETNRYIVPMTTNMYNCQEPTLPEGVESVSEILQWAEGNNISNPYLWEQRTFLLNPVAVLRSKDMFLENSFRSPFSLRVGGGYQANDSVLSTLVRRAGYKCILAKDAFCYHYDHITRKERVDYCSKEELAHEGKEFKKVTNIPFFTTGRCYSLSLLKKLDFPHKGHIEILGLNCGLSSDPLKIKESYKEHHHNLDCFVTNLQDTPEYHLDLPSLSDAYLLIDQYEAVLSQLREKKYQWIFYMDKFSFSHQEEDLYQEMKEALTEDGVLILGQPTELAKSYFTPHEMVEYEHREQYVAFLIYKK